MTPINRGEGLFPTTAIVDHLVYVAYGVPAATVLRLDVFNAAGTLVRTQDFADGFGDSFPVLMGRFLGYKRNGDWKAVSIDVVSGETHVFPGEADGNFPLTIHDALGILAYQWGRDYNVWLGSLIDGTAVSSAMTGAPDGISRLLDTHDVELRKDVRASVPGIFYPVTRGDFTVGENLGDAGGIGCLLAGDELRVALVTPDTDGRVTPVDAPVPSCATDGTLYATVTGGPGGIRILIGVRAEFAALPTAASLVRAPVPVTFSFSHPVLVAPFKDPQGATPAPAEIVVNQTGQARNRPYIAAEDSLTGSFAGPRVGIYTEAADPSAAIALAAGLQTRVFLGHDSPAAWNLPAGLRPWDVPLLELYLVIGEAVPQAIARWRGELTALLAVWPGDVGVIPMFYCGGGAPPNETFTIGDVLAGLRALSDLVNLSPRITVIAPFAYLRANGITGHAELADAFSALLVAAAVAGVATLAPVSDGTSGPAPAPTPGAGPAPAPPPAPGAPAEGFARFSPFSLGGFMQTERGGIVGPGGKFGRISAADAGKGLFGWFPLHFDVDSPDGDAAFDLSDLGGGYFVAKHVTTGAYFGVDMTKFSADLTKQFYGKPTSDQPGPGSYEAPLGFHDDAGTKFLIVKYGQSADVPHPFYSTPVAWVPA